jgi:hypothetical protein
MKTITLKSRMVISKMSFLVKMREQSVDRDEVREGSTKKIWIRLG